MQQLVGATRREVPPMGPRDAQLVLLGRDPGWTEVRDGKPFTGPSGKLLDQALAQAGLHRNQCLVTNCVRVQPPSNDWSKHDAETVHTHSADALALIAEAPRTLVVALGEQATALAVTGSVSGELPDSITNIRGYCFSNTACGVPVLAAVHPAFILRNWHPWWATFCWDAQKAARITRQGAYEAPASEWVMGGADGLRQAQNLLTPAPACLAVDIETSGTGCVAFAADANFSLVFPGQPSPSHPHADAIQMLLESNVPKVFQNGQFDVTIMERAGWRVNRWEYDTMLMWHALEPLLAGQREDARGKGKRRTEKGLRFLASLLTDFAYYKDYAFERDEQQFELCAKDAMVTWACWAELRRRLAAA